MSLDDKELARLLASARQADLPDPARLARIKSQLLPSAGAAAPQPSAVHVAAKSALALKVGAGVALAVLSGLAYRQIQRPDTPEPQRPAPTLQVPSAQPPPSAAVPELPVRDPQQPEPAPSAAPAAAQPPATATPKPKLAPRPKHEPPSPPPASTLHEEAALLRMASLAARAGRLSEARSALERFERAFPNSQLKSERDRLARDIAAREAAP